MARTIGACSSGDAEVDVTGQRLVASITVEAAREFGPREGAQATAIGKTSDAILATGG